MGAAADAKRSAEDRQPHVVVLGAGIAGLTAARQVLKRQPGCRVTVIESEDRIGGKLRRDVVAGTEVDTGAESLLFRRPEAVRLARETGLGEDLEHPTTYAARVWSRGRRHPLPRSIMGVPGDVASLTDSGLLSKAGLQHALAEPVRPRSSAQHRLADGEDVSVGDLVASRFGDEVVDRILEPLLGGVYAGDSRRLSVAACTPQILALTRAGDSLLRAAGAALAAPVSRQPVFVGIRGGVARLPAEVAADVARHGGVVRTGVTARRIERTAHGFRIETGPVPSPEFVEADGVVLAVPAPASARLLDGVAPGAARRLAGITYASSAVLSLAFAAGDAAKGPGVSMSAEGSGFLVPPVDGRLVKAATFSAAKWGWVKDAGAGRSGKRAEAVEFMRLSVGRIGEERRLQVDDEHLVAEALADLGDALGWPVPAPLDALVTRWGGGLPQYAPGHLDLIAAVRAEVAAVPALAVCGAAYDGVGIPACIASGEAAATQALAGLHGLTGGAAQ